MGKETNANPNAQSVKGFIHATMIPGLGLDDFCAQVLPEYNKDRFEAVAVRLFAGDETVLTIYAHDKFTNENRSGPTDKIPVKKFKVENFNAMHLFAFFREFNFTLNAGNFDLEEMEVMG